VDLRQSYDELRKNLGRSQEELKKILRSFENRAPKSASCTLFYPVNNMGLKVRIREDQSCDLDTKVTLGSVSSALQTGL